MLRILPCTIAILMLISASAQASWALQHLARAWGGDLTTLEVEQLSEGLDEVEAKAADGYWTLLILAIQADASGDLGRSCELVSRFDGVARSRKDLRLNTLRAACRLREGDTATAAKLASSAAKGAKASEPVDVAGVLVRAREIHATALIQQWKADPDNTGLRARAEKAVTTWKRDAQAHNDGSDLVEAMAYQAVFDR